MERDGNADAERPICSYDTEVEIDEVILRLDLTLVRPDDEQSSRLQSANSGGGQSSSRTEDAARTQNGGPHSTASDSRTSNLNGERATPGKSGTEASSSSSNSQQDEDKKRLKPLDFIRKLRQSGHQTDNHRNGGLTDGGGRRKSPEPLKVLYTNHSILSHE